MIYLNTNRWIDIIGNVIHNYNHRIHRTLGKSPNDMTYRDVSKLKKKLRIKNKPSILVCINIALVIELVILL